MKWCDHVGLYRHCCHLPFKQNAIKNYFGTKICSTVTFWQGHNQLFCHPRPQPHRTTLNTKKYRFSSTRRWDYGPVIYLRPWQTMIHVIFHLIVLRQAQQIAVLHVHQIIGLKVCCGLVKKRNDPTKSEFIIFTVACRICMSTLN